MRFISIVFLLLVVNRFAWAVDVIGPVYPVKEVSLLDVMMNKLKYMEQTGQIEAMQEQWKTIAQDRVLNPKGVALPRAIESTKRLYDPSITVNRDIYLPDGQLMHKAGTIVNPLSVKSFTKRMLFIDATDKQQLAWAKKQYESSGWRDKVILVNGSYVDVMKEWKHPVYFDQLGGQLGKRETLVSRFGVRTVPTMIYQSGSQLMIEEVKL